jgi:hypothetical protein
LEKETERRELTKSVYEQHWLHARHVENERLWFTNIFVIIMGGMLSAIVLWEASLPRIFAIIPGLICVLSLIGYYFCISWRAGFLEHTTLAIKMLKGAPELYNYAPYVKKNDEDIYKIIKVGRISAHELFLYFYAVVASAALFLSVYIGTTNWIPAVPPAVLLVVCLVLLWWKWMKKREDKYRNKMDATFY